MPESRLWEYADSISTLVAAIPRDTDARVKPSVLLLGRAPVVQVNCVADTDATTHSTPSTKTSVSETVVGRFVPAYVHSCYQGAVCRQKAQEIYAMMLD